MALEDGVVLANILTSDEPIESNTAEYHVPVSTLE